MLSPAWRRKGDGRMNRLTCVVGIVLFCSSGGARAGVILSQPPLNTGGPAADTEFVDEFGFPLWQQLADNFTLTSSAILRRVAWHGFYGGDFIDFPQPPPASETMRIRLCGARPSDGLPDDNNVLFEESFIDPLRVETGRTIFTGPDPPEFMFQVDLSTPFELEADIPYWLEIVQVGDPSSYFRWEYSPSDGQAIAFINQNVTDWQLTNFNANLAFELSSIPEPATCGFFVLGLLGAVKMTRGRREARP